MTKKLYTEEYVNNIALAIQAKTGTSDKYRISEMPAAIQAIDTGLRPEQFLDNWYHTLGVAKSLNTNYKLACWFRYPPVEPGYAMMYIGIIKSEYNFAMHPVSAIASEHGHLKHMHLFSDGATWVAGWNGSNFNTEVGQYGREIFYPIDSVEGWVVSGLSNASNDNISGTLFSMPSQFTSLGSGCHPFFTDNWGNGQIISMEQAMYNSKPKDFIKPTGYANVVDAYMLWADNRYYICMTTNTVDNPYYNTSNSKLYRNTSRVNTAYAVQFSGRGSTYTIPEYGVYNDTGSGWDGLSYQLEQLPVVILFNTMDIKDQNGNVLLEANCTLADMGIT
jgi:hypothetical protein